MIRRSIFFVLALVFSSQVFASEPAKITLGMIPGNGIEMKTNALAFAKILQQQIKVPVDIYIAKDYEGLIDAMKQKKVDFAFFTAMSFVYAEKEAKAKVLLKTIWDHPYYYSSIVVRKDSKIRKLSDLKGKKFAFVDEKSTSGYLLPMLAFRKNGLTKSDLASSVFSGNHKASTDKLLSGEVDAIAVYANDSKGIKGAWTNYHEKDLKVRPLWVSESLPTDPFTVRQDFYDTYPGFSHNVMMTLLDIPDSNKNVLKDLLGIQKMSIANSAQYEPIRKLITNLAL